MLIYLLDLTAVIYVSGILINEKFLSIDFARKGNCGRGFEVVRHSLMSVFVPRAQRAAAQASAVRLADIRRQHDEDLGTADMAEKFVQSLAKVTGPTRVGSRASWPVWLRGGLLLDGRQLLTAWATSPTSFSTPTWTATAACPCRCCGSRLLQMLRHPGVHAPATGALRLRSPHRRAADAGRAAGCRAVGQWRPITARPGWPGGPVLQRSLADSRQALQGQTRALLAAPA